LGSQELKIGFWLAMIATGLLNIGFQILRTKANALEDSSLVTPILATTPAVVIVTSMIILQEYPSAMGKIGIILLVVGGYVLNIQEFLGKRDKSGDRHWYDILAPFIVVWKSRGMRYAFIAAMIGAVSLNFDGITARTANIGFGFGLVAMIASFGSMIVAMAFGEHKDMKLPSLKGVILMGLFWAIGSWFFSMAYRETIVPYVGALKRLYIPMNAILAWWLLKEQVTGWRFFGGLTMAIGAAVMGVK
jgi:drug/metabolite transporter (DMT)-like permease